MNFSIGDRVLLTSDSEFKHQNKRYNKRGETYEVAGTVMGTCIDGEMKGKFSSSFSHFKYAVMWDEDEGEDELYYRDWDLKSVKPLPVTNQEAKSRLSKEW